MLPLGGSKGVGVSRMLAALGVPASRMVAVGDGAQPAEGGEAARQRLPADCMATRSVRKQGPPGHTGRISHAC